MYVTADKTVFCLVRAPDLARVLDPPRMSSTLYILALLAGALPLIVMGKVCLHCGVNCAIILRA